MNLKSIQITFNTHNDGKSASTVLHVFVKNRRPDTSTPMGPADYITNLLAFQFSHRPNSAGIDDFLGYAQNIAGETAFDVSSTHTFDIPLSSSSISNEKLFLPVVYIHIQADDSDSWFFSYTITFTFDDGKSQFSCSSDINGVTGIILDQDNRNYCGICVENPFNTMPAVYKPQSDMVLTDITMTFSTHNAPKIAATALSVTIVNRINATTSQNILTTTNLFAGQTLSDPSTSKVNFRPNAFTPILMQDIVLPQIFIGTGPSGVYRWIFDYQVSFHFASPSHPADHWWTTTFGSSGIILDNDCPKYAEVYNGGSFPTVDPLSKPTLSAVPANYPTPTSYTLSNPKKLYISYLQKKLQDLINSRQADPLYKVRLDNAGRFNSDTLPESYYDLQSITADPPFPGTPAPEGYTVPIAYPPSPVSLGQEYHSSFGDIYFNNLNSQTLNVFVDPNSSTPLSIELAFDCSGSNQIVGGSSVSTEGATLTSFTIRLYLTLIWDKKRNCVDLMSWATEIPNLTATLVPSVLSGAPPVYAIIGQYLGKPLVNVTAPSLSAYQTTLKGQVIDVRLSSEGDVEDAIRDSIFSTLTTKSAFDGLTPLDRLNSTVNSWLLGGALASDQGADGASYANGVAVTADINIESDAGGQYIALCFSGPKQLFVPPPYSAPVPAPGALANIDHIIVLTMENRSFDHMLGYLSLPVAQNGMGRTDVDGLKGGEVNYANGVACPSAPFPPLDTIMNPDPPHSWEPVARAINGGAMDGFAQSYCDESGIEVAKRIMMYHTAVNVPTYDAMARDFAICNRWFAAFPGPTFCNRFHELTGFLNIDADGFWESHNSSPKRAVFTANIFDYLTKQGVSWKYFENYYCFLRFFQNYTFDNQNISDYGDPGVGFVNVVQSGNLPSVTFIDPHFIELPPDGNCDGAPADVQQGQKLVNEIVTAVVSSPTWDKTMLIITYDEHGGIYDHVPPPPAAVIAENTGLPTTYGVRVPAFIVSPWVRGGSVFGHDAASGTAALYFDHTSILKTIAARFLSPNMPPMGARFEAANDLSSIIGSQTRLDLRPFLPYGLVFAPSGLSLEVNGAAATPGLPLTQAAAVANSAAQQFAFEDAGDGSFYIRTFTGRLYLTMDVPPADPAQPIAVRQAAKYASDSLANPNSQKWNIVPAQVSLIGQPMYRVVSVASPDKVLQPLGVSTSSGVSVVVDTVKNVQIKPVISDYMWVITTPLLSRGLVFEKPKPGGPILVASTSSLNFPPVEFTNTSPQQTVTLSVPQGTQFILASIAIESDNGAAGEFPSVPGPGSPPPYGSIQLQNGQLVLTVWFRPTTAGPRNAVIQIVHNLANSPTTISLSGTGVAATHPVLSCSTYSMVFNTKKPAPPPLKLTNTGTAPLVISSMVVSNSAFSIGNGFVGTLAPGESHTIGVLVRSWPGDAEILITHNAAGSPTEIDLSSGDKGGGPPR